MSKPITMTVVLNLDDLYLDEESPAGDQLLREVEYKVTRTIADKLLHTKESDILSISRRYIDSEEFKDKIRKRIDSRLANDKFGMDSIRTRLNGLIRESIQTFTKQRYWQEFIGKITKAHIKKLEEQYNEQYAIGLIKQLKEANMLSESGKKLITTVENG